MMEGMSINMLAEMDSDTFSEKLLYLLNRELTKIKK